ncbi:MAG: hypothetical protein RR483_01665, partial [Clostridia bacterium]
LYDNKRNNSNNVFHEQIGAFKTSGPSFDLTKYDVGIGSINGSLITGGWEWEYFDLSLLDFGSLNLAAKLADGTFELSALASIWSPSFTIKIGDLNIKVSGHAGSVGSKIKIGKNGFDIGAAAAVGISIKVSW